MLNPNVIARKRHVIGIMHQLKLLVYATAILQDLECIFPILNHQAGLHINALEEIYMDQVLVHQSHVQLPLEPDIPQEA